MKELLHKAWLFGVGVFDFTKEKVEALVQEMVRRGEITQQESSEAVKQLLAKAQEAQQAMVAKGQGTHQKRHRRDQGGQGLGPGGPGGAGGRPGRGPEEALTAGVRG